MRESGGRLQLAARSHHLLDNRPLRPRATWSEGRSVQAASLIPRVAPRLVSTGEEIFDFSAGRRRGSRRSTPFSRSFFREDSPATLGRGDSHSAAGSRRRYRKGESPVAARKARVKALWSW